MGCASSAPEFTPVAAGGRPPTRQGQAQDSPDPEFARAAAAGEIQLAAGSYLAVQARKKAEQDAAAGEIQSQASALLASMRTRKEAEARAAHGEPGSPLGFIAGIFSMRAEPKEIESTTVGATGDEPAEAAGSTAGLR